MSREPALAADLIRSLQFHLAREAALAADLMRSPQFLSPEEAARQPA